MGVWADEGVSGTWGLDLREWGFFVFELEVSSSATSSLSGSHNYWTADIPRNRSM